MSIKRNKMWPPQLFWWHKLQDQTCLIASKAGNLKVNTAALIALRAEVQLKLYSQILSSLITVLSVMCFWSPKWHLDIHFSPLKTSRLPVNSHRRRMFYHVGIRNDFHCEPVYQILIFADHFWLHCVSENKVTGGDLELKKESKNYAASSLCLIQGVVLASRLHLGL